jgi:hypothetical protein
MRLPREEEPPREEEDDEEEEDRELFFLALVFMGRSRMADEKGFMS